MTLDHLGPAEARRVYLLLTATRWFPVGLTIAVMVLYQLDRGLSVAQALTVSAIAGFVVLLLELPTSGFADSFGRRPVYLTAAALSVLACCVYLVADSFWMFAVGAVLMGCFRALDSGPLEAWYVDTVHLSEPGADVNAALARQGLVLGAAVATGAAFSGLLVWWHPIASVGALTLPVVVATVLNAVHLAAVALLMREPRRASSGARIREALDSAIQAPQVVRDGLRMLRTNGVVRGLMLVEIGWAVAMVVFELFQPIRLGELLGDEARAGVWMGPTAAGGWAVFAIGAALSGFAGPRIGVARTAMVARALNAVGAMAMGVVAGPAALIGCYLVTYTMHGANGPMHSALLHREASAHNRATVLSMNSMMASLALSAAAPLLGLLAVISSTRAAMVIAGAISLIGVLGYLPARRQERVGLGPATSTSRDEPN